MVVTMREKSVRSVCMGGGGRGQGGCTWGYLASDADEEVDDCVRVLLVHGLGEESFGAGHGLAAAEDL